MAEAQASARWRNLLISLIVSGGFLYLAFRNVKLDELWTALGRVNLRWLFVSVGVSLLIMVFRAWRWQLELRPLAHVPLGRLWVITSVAYMAINLLPVRLGEVVRPWLLSRRSTISFSNVVGNIVVEKTMDSVLILFYILVGLTTIENLPVWVRRGAIFPAVGAGLLVTLVLLFWWRGEAFVDRWILHLLPERFRAGMKKVLASMADGMRVIPNPGLLLAVFLVSLVMWFLPILSSYIMILAFDFTVPFSAALVVFIFVGFGTALPNLPGMIGPYQYACQLALGLFGVSEVDGLAYGLVLNAVQFLTLIAQGLLALPIAGVSFDEIRRAREGVALQSSAAESNANR
ncbi:MAG: flippase-like domain-containing protein [Deltaproteobacteria bacterium]|nr:flippase-like domain-containing protein [Deltaproteobacteria bacterium]